MTWPLLTRLQLSVQRSFFSANSLLPPQILKLAINEARPSDRKADPGMPSAHAQR